MARRVGPLTTLHLVRHGETIWHADNRYCGSTDIALTEAGLRQADRLGSWAAGQPITRVVSSQLVRAVRTAAPAAAALGLAPSVDPRLAEVDFGAGEGLTRAEMRQEFPEALAAFLAAPATSPLPGGEPGLAAIRRALPAVAELAADDSEVLVVAHSTMARLLLCHLLGLPPDTYRQTFPLLRNTAITTVLLPSGERSPADLAGAGQLVCLNVPAASMDPGPHSA